MNTEANIRTIPAYARLAELVEVYHKCKLLAVRDSIGRSYTEINRFIHSLFSGAPYESAPGGFMNIDSPECIILDVEWRMWRSMNTARRSLLLSTVCNIRLTATGGILVKDDRDFLSTSNAKAFESIEAYIEHRLRRLTPAVPTPYPLYPEEL